MRIVIARHGHAINDKLTKLGKKQAKLLACNLLEFDFDKIICSPKHRCTQTAKIINKKLKLKIEIDENLKDRWQLGKVPQTKEEKVWWNNYMNKDFKSSLPDDLSTFINRNSLAFDKAINENNKQKDILIVAHSATTYAFLNYYLKCKNPIWQKISNASFVCFEI